MSSYETMIIRGLNCRTTRSIYYGMAISLSLGCLTASLVQLWLLPPALEDKDRVEALFFCAAMFLVYAILVVRSLCVPVPTITTETCRMGEEKWWSFTMYVMFTMFVQSFLVHTVESGIYWFAIIAGALAIKQLSWPAQDIYIQHVVFIDFLCCLSCFLGYRRALFGFTCCLCAWSLLNSFIYHSLVQALPLLYSKVKQAEPACG